MSAITAANVSKRYVINHAARQDTLRDTLIAGARSWYRLLRRSRHGPKTEEFWALRDVTFDVEAGEVVGIIGRNGAGKSTLLKILSRITEATTGRIQLRGRVASLLEVGTGFHPELSGRDNIFLNGAILGMRRSEIIRRFDEIVAFAEIERFLDTPVKRYSSGMYVRLAFAVAAHLDPEILIVDEVLAVGDAVFQAKCIGKMQSVARSSGRTVLFVSHNLSAVRSLCTSAILLKNGLASPKRPVGEVLNEYLMTERTVATGYIRSEPALGPAILSVTPRTSSGGASHDVEKPFRVDVEISPSGNAFLVVGLHVFNAQLDQVVHTSSEFAGNGYPAARERITASFTLPPRTLNVGEYRFTVTLAQRNVTVFERLEHVLSITVADPSFCVANTGASDWGGLSSPKLVLWTWS